VNKNSLEFYPLVQKLELVLGSPTETMELIRLIDKQEFIQLRDSIISAFGIDFERKFTGKFGIEVEYGDVSDAVRSTTFSLYPQSTEMNKLISPDERKIWCSQIINSLDELVQYQ
jgi:hypothetical protein